MCPKNPGNKGMKIKTQKGSLFCIALMILLANISAILFLTKVP